MIKIKAINKFHFLCIVLICLSMLPSYAQENVKDTAQPATEIYRVVEKSDTNIENDDEYEYDDEYEAGPYVTGFDFSDSIENKKYQQKSVSDKDWEAIKNNPDYKYEKDNIKPKTEAPSKESKPSWIAQLIANFFEFLFSTAGNVLLWIILAAAIFWIVYSLYKSNGIYLFSRSKKKIKKVNVEDETSDDFVPESWDSVIANAVSSGNYRLAIRHSFRHVLQLMHDNNVLAMTKSKSNYQYLNELKSTPFYDDFKKLLHHYEYVWYGEFVIDENAYQKINKIYKKLRESF